MELYRRVVVDPSMNGETRVELGMGISFIVHALFVVGAFLANIPLQATTEESAEDPVYTMQWHVAAWDGKARDREHFVPLVDDPEIHHASGRSRCCDDGAVMGDEASPPTEGHYAVQGPADNPDPHIARDRAFTDGTTYYPVGTNPRQSGGDPDSLTAPWGRDDSLGVDPVTARASISGELPKNSSGTQTVGMYGGWTIQCAQLQTMVGKAAGPLARQIAHARLHACMAEAADRAGG